MSALLEVLDAGVAVTVQDAGRIGYRRLGVPVSGALDSLLMAAANALVGNDDDAAVLEVFLSGPTLKAVSGTIRVGLAGNLGAQLLAVNGQIMKVQPWETVTLFPGDVLRIGSITGGVAYVAVSGGINVAPQLGSRSTYLRAAIGGINGSALAVGDRFGCGLLQGDPWLSYRGTGKIEPERDCIRVIPGPQHDYFTMQAVAHFFSGSYRVTRDMDRMGMRLQGEPLVHNEKGTEIVSDGVVPGVIQVPPNGQPIVLLADCQTSGGYPKIATVIRADLPRLAHARPDDVLHFVAVGHAEAAMAWQRQKADFALWREAVVRFRPPGVIDEAALYAGNLISGVVRGDEYRHRTAAVMATS